jgi:hypothetical protein
MKVLTYLKDVETNDPLNLGELSIDITYDKDGNKESATLNNFVFGVNDLRKSNDAFKLCTDHVYGGLTGGVGVFEGLPLRMVLDNQRSTKYTLFDGYLDISKASIVCGEVTAPAIEQGKIDWLNDRIDAFDFKYLYDTGFFTKASFIPVPYVINKKGNEFELALTLASLFVMTNAFKTQFNNIKREITSTGNPFSTVSSSVNLVLEILYCITLLAAIIKLLFDLYNLLIQPVKYHNGMRAVDLVQIGLSYLGLTLSSTILQQYPFNKMVIIPEKYNIKDDNVNKFKFIVGQLTGDINEKEGFYKGTFGALFRALKLMFNAKIQIVDNVVYFEKQDFNITPSQYRLPNLQDTGYKFNSDDLKANRILSFTLDQNDRNTIQEYGGNAYQVVHSPIAVNHIKMVTINGLDRQVIPFSRGLRKTSLTFIEQGLNVFFKVFGTEVDIIIKIVNLAISAINGIIRALNKLIKILKKIGINLGGSIPSIPKIQSPNIQNLIESRIDMLKMESDFIASPKVVLVDDHANKRNNKLLLGNEQFLNAKYLYDNYHYFNNFVTTNGWNNQFLIRRFENIPFTFDNYEMVRTNGSILTFDGKEAILIDIKYDPISQTASGTYKVKHIYTNNLKLNNIYPNE